MVMMVAIVEAATEAIEEATEVVAGTETTGTTVAIVGVVENVVERERVVISGTLGKIAGPTVNVEAIGML